MLFLGPTKCQVPSALAHGIWQSAHSSAINYFRYVPVKVRERTAYNSQGSQSAFLFQIPLEGKEGHTTTVAVRKNNTLSIPYLMSIICTEVGDNPHLLLYLRRAQDVAGRLGPTRLAVRVDSPVSAMDSFNGANENDTV